MPNAPGPQLEQAQRAMDRDPEAEPLQLQIGGLDRCPDCGRLLWICRTDAGRCSTCGDQPHPA